MVSVVGIQLQKNGKIYYFDANGFDLSPGSYVIADTVRGADLGEVAVGVREIDETESPAPLKKIIRIATAQDIQHSAENRAKEKEAYSVCQKKITEHELDMKLVSVEYAFDNSKIIFYFTANGRVDFRSLVKDLASVFKMRIELRQIGVRDEARMLGGLGPCGRTICCGSFLSDFQPVSIKMAKEQNLSLNPTKISGVCGRLMCCLKYEQDHYEKTRKKMPRIGKEVHTPDGKGTVTELNVIKETVRVRIISGDTSEIKEYPMESVIRIQDSGKQPDLSKEDNDEVFIPEDDITDEEVVISADEEEKISENEEDEPRKKPVRQHNGKKNRDHRYSSQLGKPVRRENPNRTKTDLAADRGQNPGAAQKVSKAPAEKQPESINSIDKKPVNKQDKKDNWAEALKKAMDAVN